MNPVLSRWQVSLAVRNYGMLQIYTKKYLEETRNFAASHTNYILIENSAPKFRNLQVSIMDENWIMLSKTKNPTIHFVIQEPKLCKTVWKMIEKRKAKESRE